MRLSDLIRKSAAKNQDAEPQLSLAAAGSRQSEAAGRSEDRPPRTEPSDRSEVTHYYQSARQEVERILDLASQGTTFSVGRLQQIVTGMVKGLITGDELLVHALNGNETGVNLARHMVNTSVLAVKIAQGAGCRVEELPWIGLAACLHDVGMVIVPRRILEKPDRLAAEEIALMRRHPEKGFRILQSLGSEFEWLANVALQEHEREDGSGYPGNSRGKISTNTPRSSAWRIPTKLSPTSAPIDRRSRRSKRREICSRPTGSSFPITCSGA